MHTHTMIAATIAALLTSTCAKRAPEPAGIAPGTPSISWIIMHGDADNPDREFACQSHPRNDCVVPASRPDAQVVSHVYFYYRGAAVETKYTGSIRIGFLQGSATATSVQANITRAANESIANQSVTGIVTSAPGTYRIAFDVAATATAMGTSQPIREEVAVVVN